MHIPIDIYQCASKFLKLKNILRMFRISSYVYDNLRIKKIIGKHYNLNDNIINQKKYLYLKELNATNSQITDINHLENLKILRCDCTQYYIKNDTCLITNNGIKNLTKIEKLSMNFNRLITEINHLVNLKTLHISGTNMRDAGIKGLTNIEKLTMSHNNDITYIGNMTRLKKLKCDSTNISNDSLKNMQNLEVLHCGNNIYNINHLTKLRILVCFYHQDNFTNENIKDLTNLTYLKCTDAEHITDVNNLKNLEYLECGGYSGISNSGIKNLKNIRTLKMGENTKITNINHLSKLEELYCKNTMVSDNDIKDLVNLRKIELSNHITTIKNFTKLTHVALNYYYTISYDELRKVKFYTSGDNRTIDFFSQV